jgi:hypothetical protein
MVRMAVRAMGLQLLARDENASHALTSVIAPESIGANKIRKYMADNYNIILAGGQQKLDNVIFRIGHLGYVRNLTCWPYWLPGNNPDKTGLGYGMRSRDTESPDLSVEQS